ncbi:MAG TPA: lamin tail domain-containing protein, partial [Paludibacter sp.]|nr:lamin tail domain-containing protein [Paludibacter sp.]
IIYSFTYAQSVRINEFMALNEATLTDENGEFSDWIEIYNPSGATVNLQGWALTDDITMPYKWVFPAITLKAGEFLIVFASSKDRAIAGSELHTNFSLKGSGEYLALVQPSGVPATEFKPAYPPQTNGFSCGFYNNNYIEFSKPTPGKDNSLSTGIVIPVPVFSKKHGFYESPFQLQITSGIANGAIYYTTDGSVPTKTNGTLYTLPINISTTTIVRAITIVEGENPGKTGTQSYLFLNNIIRQNNTPAGYPANWGPYTAIPGTAIADYEMDADLMKDATYAAAVKKALTELPTISIVTDKSHLFSSSTDPNTGGIYIYTGAPLTTTTYETGRDWERPVSFEYFDKDSTLQIDCGIRLQGGHGRRPEKSPKHSFLLVFDSKYGPSKLNYPLFGKNSCSEFENVILRAGFGNSWVHQDNAQRIKATYQEDIWTKDTQRALKHPSGNSIYAHLYINGIYWGIYAPSERMDKEFAEQYMGGNEDDYDVIKDYAEVSDGDILAWSKLMEMANAGLESNEKYQLVQGKNPDGTPNYASESLVDVVNLADYMLINFYSGNTDWDHHNWSAMRNRLNPGKGFKFLCWDVEVTLGSVNTNVLAENNDNCPSRVYQQLLKNAEFKRLFADRIQRHFFNDGLLTPDSAAARWLSRKAQIESPIICESARWGDYRRDVHQYQAGGPFLLYNKENHWVTQQNFILNTYFPQRTGKFITQLKEAGLFPTVDAPVFYINSKAAYQHLINAGDKISMTSTKGTIYYTTNGTDPVDWNTGTFNPQNAIIYSQAVPLNKSVHIIARTFYNGQWSAANKRFYVVPTDYADLKITEIHYHPLGLNLIDDSDFEFVEIKNTGVSTLDVGGLKFTEGIEYEFPSETQLGAGEFIVLASNSNNFFSRYKFRPFDEYNGKLDNAGERLVLQTQYNEKVIDFSYGTSENWPTPPDGTGYSLVPVVYNPKNNQANASDWRTSYKIGGSPGTDDIPLSAIPEIPVTSKNGVLLAQNYPNPFAGKTYIDYSIPENAYVELSVYNLTGQKITTLVNSTLSAGLHQTEWNGCDRNNKLVPEGIYFYRIVVKTGTDTVVLSRKMVVR